MRILLALALVAGTFAVSGCAHHHGTVVRPRNKVVVHRPHKHVVVKPAPRRVLVVRP